jgi:hypothetical protein
MSEHHGSLIVACGDPIGHRHERHCRSQSIETFMKLCHRWSAAALAGFTIGCATPRSIVQMADAHAGATFEATAMGCDRTRRSEPRARRFDDLGAAVVWGKEVATLAPGRSCDVLIDALREGRRQAVYRVSRDRWGVWSIGPADAIPRSNER